MPYNKFLGYQAPLPSGALPTEEELAALVRQNRHRRLSALGAWFRRHFHR